MRGLRFTSLVVVALLSLSTAPFAIGDSPTSRPVVDVRKTDRARDLKAADAFLKDEPITVTAAHSPRSSGGEHDFFSEGDYWWPDPKNPDGPYIQKDGETNPDNFVEHRHAMIRLSEHVASLTSAYLLTGEQKYADAAIKHLKAWFVDEKTKMNPNLEYAQAIHGRFTGRGTGIIDTLHLVEVARSAQVLAQAGVLKGDDLAAIRKWFSDYTNWMITSKNGQDEMKAANNHGTCWATQVAAFASFTGEADKVAMCRKRFKEIFIPSQEAEDGSFPKELGRTKPYGYSLFNLDAMCTLAQIASTPDDNLWEFKTADGRDLHRAVEYMYPFIKDKKSWPKKPDVMFWEFWPVRCPSLLFAGIAYGEGKYIDLWNSLDANPTNEEVIRNLPIRHPVIWIGTDVPPGKATLGAGPTTMPANREADAARPRRATQAPLNGKADPRAPGYIVVFEDKTNAKAEVARLQKDFNFTPTHVFDVGLKGFSANLNDDTVDKLRWEPAVKYIEHDGIASINGKPAGGGDAPGHMGIQPY